MHSLGRAAYFTAVAILWLLVLAFGVEAWERGRLAIGGALYQSFFEEQNRRVYRMVPEAEVPPAPGAPSLITAAPTPGPQTDCSPDAALRDAYGARGARNAEAVETLRGEMHARYSPDLKLLDIHGDPLFKRAVAATGILVIHPQMSELMQSGSTELPPHRWLAGPGSPGEVRVSRGSNGEFHLAVKQLLPLMEPPNPPMPEDVATEITSFSYKRNWRREGAMASYNNFGFRDDDVVVPKPPGVFRIVCVGGSTTEEGNSNDTSYPNLMEQQLRRRFGDGVEVINCGISGITSYLEWRRMDDYLALQPDIIVYYNAINDITHEHFPLWLRQEHGREPWWTWSAVLTRLWNRRLLPPDDALRQDMEAHTMINLRAMGLRARECGVAFAVCSFALADEEMLSFRDRLYLDLNLQSTWHGGRLHYGTLVQVMALHNELLRQMCEQDGHRYIPVAEELHGGMEEFFDNCHMTPKGMALKVDIIARHVGEVVADILEESDD